MKTSRILTDVPFEVLRKRWILKIEVDPSDQPEYVRFYIRDDKFFELNHHQDYCEVVE